MLTLITEFQYKKSQYESLYSMRIKKFLSAKCPVWSGICLSCTVQDSSGGKDLQKREVLSLEWKSEGVPDGW